MRSGPGLSIQAALVTEPPRGRAPECSASSLPGGHAPPFVRQVGLARAPSPVGCHASDWTVELGIPLLASRGITVGALRSVPDVVSRPGEGLPDYRARHPIVRSFPFPTPPRVDVLASVRPVSHHTRSPQCAFQNPWSECYLENGNTEGHQPDRALEYAERDRRDYDCLHERDTVVHYRARHTRAVVPGRIRSTGALR
jgi:hypothetical protein